jgi:hypothetical protein
VSWLRVIEITQERAVVRDAANESGAYPRYPGNKYGRAGCPVNFGGKPYRSIAAAARANGISGSAVRLAIGRKSDPRKRHDR